MSLTRDQELCGMALWVEKTHGQNGWFHIAQEQDRLPTAVDFDGVKLWRLVGERFERFERFERLQAGGGPCS